MSTKKYRIVQACHDGKHWKVEYRNFIGFWCSGYVWKDFFALSYESKELAEESVMEYINRYKPITQK